MELSCQDNTRDFKSPLSIKEVFIPVIIGKFHVTKELRKIMSLPARMGGLSLINICETAELEYANSKLATESLKNAIFNQENEVHQKEVITQIKANRDTYFAEQKSELEKELPPSTLRQLELLSEKGASSWLTSLPLKEYGFLLNKQEFQDAISLRYNLVLSSLNRPSLCVCGQPNTINHCLTCKLGGMFP